jgi:hypothetical protein
MKIKGNSLVVVPKVIKKQYGEEGLRKWLDNLSPEANQLYLSDIDPTNWYTLDKYYLDPVQKYCDLFLNGDLNGAYDMGGADAANSLKGVYGLFIKMGSPEYLVKKASILFPTYYKNAKMEIAELGKGKCVLRIFEFGKMRKINEQTINGWMHKAMEICGVKITSMNITQSNTENDKYSEFSICWE